MITNRDFLGYFSKNKPNPTDVSRMIRIFGYSPQETVFKDTLFLYGDFTIFETPKFVVAISGYCMNEINANLVERLELIPTQVMNSLDGLFRLIHYNYEKRILLLTCDYFAKRTIYYRAMMDEIIFSNNTSILANWGDREPELDISGLQHFAGYAYTPAPHTLFKNVYEIPFGSYMTIKLGEDPQIKKYWSVPVVKQKKISYPETTNELKNLIQESVSRTIKVIDGVPGFFCSGGLDTSSVIWAGSKILKDKIRTYTVGFNLSDTALNKEYDEANYANTINNHFSADANVTHIDGKIAKKLLLPAIFAMEKPSGDALNTYFVLNSIKNEKHILSGTGGDEIFYGVVFYPLLKWMRKRKLMGIIPNPLRRIISNAFVKSDKLSRRVLAAYMNNNLVSLYSTWRTQQSRYELLKYFSEEYSSNLYNEQKEFEEMLLAFKDIPLSTQISYLTLRDIVAGVQLRDIEHMSGKFGIFVWSPLLSKKILEFMYSLPFNEIAIPNVSKPLLQNAMQSEFPEEIMRRSKRGFIIPMQVWLEKDLRFLAERIIKDGKHKELGYWRHERLLELLAELKKPRVGYTFFKIWNVIVAYIWCRMHLIEKRETPPSVSIEEWLG
ncbi:MAG: hypothetical protein JXA60_00490 [Candidatus Coatesbacteria bacterium]|nr:hypothetical protein [Candidatus Coatesbacteria bacterium]